MILEIIIFAMFILDMFMTRSYLKLYQQKFPKNDYILAEANPMIRFFVRRFGINEGIFISSIFIATILIALLTFVPQESKWFFLGLYYSVNVHHYVNNNVMKKLNIKLKGGKK